LVGYELFKKKNIKIALLSGLSLGEYSCLYPAQVLDLEGLVYLIKERASAMEEASKYNPSCMFAVIGLPRRELETLSSHFGFYLANNNSSQQTAISLKKQDKEKIKAILEEKSAKVIELDVGGGFHSIFMEPAKKHLAKIIETLKFDNAKIPVVSNYTAKPAIDKDEIKSNLINQLTSTVLWQDCIEYMAAANIDIFFEIGPSMVLRGLIRKINPELKVINIEKKEDLDSV
jgi:[acyl-carrier-protein] S-malonyltransferase